MGVPASRRTMAWLRTRLPHLRLVVLVKSPADRFMSNPLASAKLSRFQASVRAGTNAMPRKLHQLLLDNCYVEKLEAWLGFFPADRFLLIRSEDLRSDDLRQRQAILDEVHAFLKVGPHSYAEDDLDYLGHFKRATNESLAPVVRTTLNCLPPLRACERRLEGAVKSKTDAFRWCDDARRGARAVVLFFVPVAAAPWLGDSR